MVKGIQIITLEEAEKRFNIKDTQQKALDFALKAVELGYETHKSQEEIFPLTDQRRIFFEERIKLTQYLLSKDVRAIDRIIAILKHMAWKTTLIKFKLIKDDTDVIISYQIKDQTNW